MSSQDLPTPFSFSDSYEETLAIVPPRQGFLSLGGQGRQYPVHYHQELEFNLVVSGRARYFLGDRRYDLQRGTLVWLFPAQGHILLERTPDYRHWVVCFRPELVEYACRSEPGSPLTEPSPVGWFCRGLSPEVLGRLDMLLTEVAQQGSADVALLNAGLAYVLRLAWSSFQAAAVTTSTKLPGPVERAALLLRLPESDDLSVAQLAERVGISAPYLSRLFSQHLGMTIPAFRSRCRVERFLQIGRAHV